MVVRELVVKMAHRAEGTVTIRSHRKKDVVHPCEVAFGTNCADRPAPKRRGRRNLKLLNLNSKMRVTMIQPMMISLPHQITKASSTTRTARKNIPLRPDGNDLGNLHPLVENLDGHEMLATMRMMTSTL